MDNEQKTEEVEGVAPVVLDQARQFYRLGMLKGWEIWRNGEGKGWLVVLITKLERQLVLVPSRQVKPKVFLTLDPAIRSLEEIGFVINGLRS